MIASVGWVCELKDNDPTACIIILLYNQSWVRPEANNTSVIRIVSKQPNQREEFKNLKNLKRVTAMSPKSDIIEQPPTPASQA
jgi:hypothetical protein